MQAWQHSARRLRPGGAQNKFWLTVGLCALGAALMFLPFVIMDGGFFHYAGDFNSQQISFYRYMNGFFKNPGYPAGASGVKNTFSWATDLGSGVMNAYSFYLYGSPFFWLSLLFPQQWLPYLMAPLLVLKIAVAGGGAYLWARRWLCRPNAAVLAACLYAFSGFTVYNIFFNHFIDVVALFPWMLWALDECIFAGRRGLFAFWVAVNLLNNYFFFAGQVVFLLIYFACRLWAKQVRLTPRLFGCLAFESVLGVALGCLLIWPAFLSLLHNPRTVDLASGWGMLTYSRVQQYLAILLSWVMPPDSPYIVSIWSEGVIKWTSMTAYLPLCSLAGALAYWRSRSPSAHKRMVAVCAVCALVPILNSAFYALNSSYYARWYYMPVLILAQMTAAAWEAPDITPAQLQAPARGLGWVMLATLAFALVPVREADGEGWRIGVLQNPGQYALMLAFGLGGLVLYGLICSSKYRPGFARRLLAGVLAFGCVFGIAHIAVGKLGQWYVDGDLVRQYRAAAALKQEMPAGSYRIDTYGTHDNLGLWLDRSCLQYFGSTAAPSILSFYPGVGVKRDVRSEPDVADYGLRGLLSVEYTIVDEADRAAFEQDADEGWLYLHTKHGFAVYRNQNYVPMAFCYDYYITEEEYQAVPAASRSQLLMRALVLSEEDAVRYGRYLQPLPAHLRTGFGYDAYVEDCNARRASGAQNSVQLTSAGLEAEVYVDQAAPGGAALVFFSVPYDQGFTAYVQGQPAELLQVDQGLMAVLCPAGWSMVELVYQPAGLQASRTVTLAAIPVFLLYTGWHARRRRSRAAAAR